MSHVDRLARDIYLRMIILTLIYCYPNSCS